jgi:hypothetical protein
MLYLDDRLPTHPKILKAGERLGPGGASKALHLYVLGLAHARQNLTDGFVSDAFVVSVRGLFASSSVAVALADKHVRLWRRVRGGYRIHDYHHYNPKAAEVKEKRERDRVRKHLERHGRHGRNGNLSTMDIARTRARAVPVPVPVPGRTSTNQPLLGTPDEIRTTEKYLPPLPRRNASENAKMQKTQITLRQLCAVAREQLEADPTIDDAEWRERIKCRIAALEYDYPRPALIGDAMTRIERALPIQRPRHDAA